MVWTFVLIKIIQAKETKLFEKKTTTYPNAGRESFDGERLSLFDGHLKFLSHVGSNQEMPTKKEGSSLEKFK